MPGYFGNWVDAGEESPSGIFRSLLEVTLFLGSSNVSRLDIGQRLLSTFFTLHEIGKLSTA